MDFSACAFLADTQTNLGYKCFDVSEWLVTVDWIDVFDIDVVTTAWVFTTNEGAKFYLQPHFCIDGSPENPPERIWGC